MILVYELSQSETYVSIQADVILICTRDTWYIFYVKYGVADHLIEDIVFMP